MLSTVNKLRAVTGRPAFFSAVKEAPFLLLPLGAFLPPPGHTKRKRGGRRSKAWKSNLNSDSKAVPVYMWDLELVTQWFPASVSPFAKAERIQTGNQKNTMRTVLGIQKPGS